MEKGKYRQLLLWLVWLALLLGCTYRTPEEDWEKNGWVRLVLDWGTRASRTGVFDYYFYAGSNPVPLIRRGDASGYEGTLPKGSYGVVVCNPDGVNLDLSMNNGYALARAIARTSAFTKAGASSIQQPANLYGTGCEEIQATAKGGKAVVLTPVCLTKEVILNILIEGGGEIAVIDGELSGIPPEICIPTGEPCAEGSASVYFPAEADGENRYTASLSLFGLRPGNKPETTSPANLSLSVEQKDGQTFVSHTDVTEQVNEAVIHGLSARIELNMTVHPLATGGYGIEINGWREGTAEVEGTNKEQDEDN